MTTHRAKITAALRAQEHARERLIEALAEAGAAGHTSEELAEQVGVTRITLWRWLNDVHPRERGRAEGKSADPVTTHGGPMSSATQAMPAHAYSAPRTAQITEPTDSTSTLVVHELGDDGRTLCHDPIRPWNGIVMVLTPQGPGTVTCGRCARIHNARV